MNTFGRYFFVIALSAVTNLGWSFEPTSRFHYDGSSTTGMLNSFDMGFNFSSYPIMTVTSLFSSPIGKTAERIYNSRSDHNNQISLDYGDLSLVFAPMLMLWGVCEFPFGCYYYAKGVVTGEHSWNLSDVHPSQPFFQLYPEEFDSSYVTQPEKPSMATDDSCRARMNKSFEDAAKFIPAPLVCVSQITVLQFTEIFKGNDEAPVYGLSGARNLPISPLMTVYGMARGVQGSYYFAKGVVTGEFSGNQRPNEQATLPKKNGKTKQ